MDTQRHETKVAQAPNGKASRRKMTSAEQRAEFERVAREHGTDQDEEAFKAVLRKLGKTRQGDA